MTRIVVANTESIAEAAELLKQGRLVAFPTETVYGLGANALDADAVARIFAAKGRPATNPVIVHIADRSALAQLAQENTRADALMEAFWPGPLTLVLPRTSLVPKIVTADGPTVAVRMPAHPVALALIRAAGVPLAAPSANRSEQLSPTRAVHVAESLGDRVDLILDGGPTQVGLESTVLDVTVWPPILLRPGKITPQEIAQVIGLDVVTQTHGTITNGEPSRSPGQMARHYAPRTPLQITDTPWAAALAFGERVAVLALTPPPDLPEHIEVTPMPPEANAYAAMLYDTLHDLDRLGVTRIFVESVPDTEAWLAVRDRLKRAASP